MVDDCLQPKRAPGRSTGNRVIEPLGGNVARATVLSAAKSTNCDAHVNGASVRRQVQEVPLIAAVHPLGLSSALGARANRGQTSGGNEDAIWSNLEVIHQQAGRRQ